MKKNKTCESCGARIVEYVHSLNKGLVGALYKLYRYGRPCKISTLDITHTQICNFQKLSYWGLVRRHHVESDHRRKGWWSITGWGESFIEGKARISQSVVTRRGKAIGSSEKMLWVTDVDEGYLYRQDYADQASGQMNLV